jgi:hypothetical protein
MQALAQWWRRLALGSVRQAWGLAPDGGAWALVGLTRPKQDLAKVHTSLSLQPPVGIDFSDMRWLSQHLRQKGRSRGGSSHRLNMALSSDQLQEGHIDFPADLSPTEWLYEVQLEVSQALQLAPDAVNFDFEPEPFTEGLVQRVHWMGCAQAHLIRFKSCTRAAGWRLATVESETQAAERAVGALQGGVASLLTQPPQDWLFRLSNGNHSGQKYMPMESDGVIQEAARQVLATPTGSRLVASGLALKAWL